MPTRQFAKKITRNPVLCFVLIQIFLVTSTGFLQQQLSNADETNTRSGIDMALYNGTSLFQSAEADYADKRWKDAAAKCEKFIKLFPNNNNIAKAHLMLGKYKSYVMKHQDAIEEYDNCIKKSPVTRIACEAKCGKAALYHLMGDYSKAYNLFKEVLGETKDWDMVKYCTYRMKQIGRQMVAMQANNYQHESRPKQCFRCHECTPYTRTSAQCGAKALAEIFMIKKKDVSLQEISDELSLNGGLASLKDIKSIAESHGLNATAVRFRDVDELKNVPMPVIAHLNVNHYVVVTALDEKVVKVTDPDIGNLSLTKETFKKKWSGYTLVFSQKKHDDWISNLLNEEEMKNIRGGHHLHGNDHGDSTENPNTAYDNGPSPISSCNGIGMPNLSVNLASFNLLIKDTDFSYSGRGPDVYVTRAYNADSSEEGAFGRSWTFNYEVSLEEDPFGDVEIKRESGKLAYFTANGDGTFNSPRWNYDKLTKNADGTFDLWKKRERVTQHFNSQGRLERITDRNGNSVTLQYAGNRLQSVTDAVGRVTTFTYNANGKITAITAPDGRQATFTYDGNNNLIKTIDMAGNEVSYTYNSVSYMTSITTPKGTFNIENVFYKSNTGDKTDGYIVSSVTDPLGNKKIYRNDITIISVVDAKGDTWQYFIRSPNGETTEITDPLGNKVKYGLDYMGNRNSVTDPNGNKTDLTYDTRGNVTNVTDPLSNTMQFTYDGNDNLTKLTDPAGNIYNYVYDSNDNLTKITDPEGGVTNFSYNAYGELTNLTDARGNSINFTYDSSGNITTVTSPGGKHTYTYDGVGRVISHTDPKGKTTRYTYDGIDRLTKVIYPDGFEKTYVYDCCGLSSVTGRNGTVTFSHDNANRLQDFTDVYGNTVSYVYDDVGNLTSLTYPDGKVVNYEYDAANRLVKVTDWLNNVTNYEYDSAGNLVKTTYPNRSTIVHKYDNADRMKTILDYNANGTVNADFDYTIDSLGNRTVASSYQPLKASPSTQNINYTYDADNRLLTAGGATFGYDNNGNLKTRTQGGSVTTYLWNYDNMLTQVVKGGDTYAYKYDPLGNRVAKSVNGIETRYVVDPVLSSILAETNASGDITAYYVYGLGLISKITPAGQAYYYHYDGLGSTIAITDLSGNIVNKYAYDAFGRVLSSEETIPNPFKYVGRFGVMDEGNGLLYMRARYYDPEIGRFINKDPIGLLGGLNLYAYGGNNPVRFNDPFGLYKPNLIDILSRRGNWGGEHWSGRRWVEKGELGDISVPAANWEDAWWKRHDIGSYCHLPLNTLLVKLGVTSELILRLLFLPWTVSPDQVIAITVFDIVGHD